MFVHTVATVSPARFSYNQGKGRVVARPSLGIGLNDPEPYGSNTIFFWSRKLPAWMR